MLGLLDRVRARGHWLGLALLVGVTVSQLDGLVEESMPNVVEDGDGIQAVTRCDKPGPAWFASRANLAYRGGRLDDAAWLASQAAHAGATHPDDRIDYANLAEQYARLATAWRIGFDPETSAIDALPAVREAWKLDTVLGGELAGALQERLALVAPQAALDFFAHDQLDEAEQALAMVELLGIDDARMHKLGIAIAKRRR
ncbi:MAG TPA: hypothetical protein VFQ53_13810 [Kofleriaceae bacterium]|nr:hypothetical protein [Kofleriaceae bacterium]